MLFNSWGYLLFFTLAASLHWLLPHRARVHLLWVGSLLFYGMWRWDFALLIVFSALVDYFCAQRIHASDDNGVRRRWLTLSLSINLGLLVVFKYSYFLSDNLVAIAGLAGYQGQGIRDLGFEIILPLGISFYTFQTISYSIDVYRRVRGPADDFWTFLTYVTFWPQLIAGPILRASEVLPQIVAKRRFDLDRLQSGLMLILVGLTKKVVFADTLSIVVDQVYASDFSQATAFDVWVAAFLFGFQIYFDFAGYSDIAIGSARVLGFDFPDNFNWPYLAVSPKDFWKRWHISLSSWIRDYLYLPLSGQQFQTRSAGGMAVAAEEKPLGNHRTQLTFALFLTWFIMGLWHGAAWNFAIWGVYHAGLVYLYRLVRPLQKLPERWPVVAWGLTLMLSMAGWIPFRATSVDQTLVMFGRLLDPRAYHLSGRILIGYSYVAVAVLLVGMVACHLLRRWHARRPLPAWVLTPATALGVALMVATLIALMRPVQQFIYFQF